MIAVDCIQHEAMSLQQTSVGLSLIGNREGPSNCVHTTAAVLVHL